MIGPSAGLINIRWSYHIHSAMLLRLGLKRTKSSFPFL